jgi:glyoxylase-like metal-dependent hydrolase (beta-lactamase superfamily II)
MPNSAPNVGVITMRSTHYYLIDCKGGKLMYEAGWAGRMPMLLSYLRAYGVAPAEIKYVMYSHNHTDHADLVQEVKQTCGARLIIHEAQIPHLPWMEEWHARKGEPFVPIQVTKSDLVVSGPHPRIPAEVGLGGYVVHTPGHGLDHITLVLDDGRAFTGDLHTPDLTGMDNYPVIQECWRTLVKLGARSFFPAHGEPYGMEKVEGYV